MKLHGYKLLAFINSISLYEKSVKLETINLDSTEAGEGEKSAINN